uniref:Protein swallow n=1 Tax=Zeugodacus cucurbitae TaxID=28588 RepID=A0A0A1XSJ4_ZEUCU
MSIQDESFPHDELFEMDLSPTPLNRFQFPHRLRERQQQKLYNGEIPKSPLTLVHNFNTSSSSADQTISSAESATEQAHNAAMLHNDRMIKSDQSGLASMGETRTQLLEGKHKSHSYHDIHTAYTKRRYKHVESKVGQYIANIRSEDERRRYKLARFQRHRSMPEALVHDPQALKRLQLQRGVTMMADKLNQALVHVIDGVEEENEEEEGVAEQEASTDLSVSNVTALTSATMSTQSGSGGAADDDDDDEDNHRRRADESANGVSCVAHKMGVVDKATYALLLNERDRLQSYNDHQQMILDEKQSEIIRLRHNVDVLRVQLSTIEDQLKRNGSGRQGLTGMTSGSFGHSQSVTNGMPYWATGRQSLQGLLYCASKTTKATQTEFARHTPPPPPPPSPSPLHLGLPHNEQHLFVTPEMSDDNNNHCVDGTTETTERNMKSVAAIQPMSLNFSNYTDAASAERRLAKDSAILRRRSNSLKFRHIQVQTNATHHNVKSQHNSRTSQPSSSDSAIDVEVIELSSSPKPARRKRYGVELTTTEHATFVSKVRNLHYDRDQRTPSPSGLYIERCPNSTAMDMSAVVDATQGAARRSALKRSGGRSISRRWLRLFGSCMRCKNPQQHEREQFALQQTYTQIPLLEHTFDKSTIPLHSN